jgi:hypothetical protein
MEAVNGEEDEVEKAKAGVHMKRDCLDRPDS